jgi:hypothetical protein
MVDASDLRSDEDTRVGSIPTVGTTRVIYEVLQMYQDLKSIIDMYDWEIDVLIGAISAFAAVVALRITAWFVILPKSWLTVSARRVMMPRDPPEVIGQKMADAIVDWAEDNVYRKVLSPEAAMFMYLLMANVLGDKDYLPKGEKLLRERLDKILNPPASTAEAVTSILSKLQTKKG